MARRKPPTVHGLVVVDKPAGWTSHDVVAKARGILGERRVGHSGTLDPDATGVLLLGVGSVTRLLRFLTALGKTYTGEIVLGIETNTLDASGTVTATYEMPDVTLEAARAAAATLTGPILQIPPMVSAVQVGGRRLHELAREGIEIEREARPVTVHRFEVSLTAEPAVLACEVECSSGTYVRTLAADLGTLLGGGAHLRNLRRTAVGSFTVAEARGLDDLQLLPPLEALRDYPLVEVDDDTAALVRNGRILDPFAGTGPWAVCDRQGELLAMYEAHGERAKPAVVMAGLSPEAP
jgi:tRNA pseudouridine55 synthase